MTVGGRFCSKSVNSTPESSGAPAAAAVATVTRVVRTQSAPHAGTVHLTCVDVTNVAVPTSAAASPSADAAASAAASAAAPPIANAAAPPPSSCATSAVKSPKRQRSDTVGAKFEPAIVISSAAWASL